MATAPLLRDHLFRPAPVRPAFLVLDLTSVEFLGAAGISVVVAAEHGDGIQGRLHVVTPAGGPVLRALRLTGVHHLLRIHPDVDHALAAVDRARRN